MAISAVFYDKPQMLFKDLLERYIGRQEVQYRADVQEVLCEVQISPFNAWAVIEWPKYLATIFKYHTKVRLLRTCGNNMLYCESIDKLKWLVRWLVSSDICSGALLPYCLEPYEYHE